MFIDKVVIRVKSGAGGHGAATFRREKYVAQGGPSGGDGGQGGSVILQATDDRNTLLDFMYRKEFIAEPGEPGGSKNKTGKDSPDVVLMVPVGTVVYDEASDAVLADLYRAGDTFVAAKGGRGGRGNQHFATATNRAPTYSEPGGPAEARTIRLELKLIADVGLVGLPNAGKSTLISVISAAKPKIADYPFTTLEPQLGVVRFDDGETCVVADIPGLIEGAHTGAGLGHEFLRHVERTRLLLHLVDASGGFEERDPLEDWQVISTELEKYSDTLAKRPVVAVLNKVDLPEAQANVERLRSTLEAKGVPVFAISGATREGLEPLLRHVRLRLREIPRPAPYVPEAAPVKEAQKPFAIQREGEVFVVRGEALERMLETANLDNPEFLLRFQRTLERMGIYTALRASGVRDGDTVRIGDLEFDFVE